MLPRISRAASLRAACLVALLIASGCHLTVDLEDYPYEPPLIITTDEGEPRDMRLEMAADPPADQPPDLPPTEEMGPSQTEEMGQDMPPDLSPPEDMKPAGPPQLMFTELLTDPFNTSNNQEDAEFFEIYNVGQGPADPFEVRIEIFNVTTNPARKLDTIKVDMNLSGPEEQMVLDAIADRSIPVGAYFTFLAQANPEHGLTNGLEPGSYYAYETWNKRAPLSNSGGRRLELFYGADPVPHDTLTWYNDGLVTEKMPIDEDDPDALPMEEGYSWSLDPSAYTPAQNDLATSWCYEQKPIIGESVTNHASPNDPLDGMLCIRDIMN